ncbi:hypothetical protein DNU06_09885 [Putridiphycobacter roseus]|uniref:Carboxypeptidase regulatory-like domain-containing protein n=1 Tax=Putridiphycobacter roseus TaxID=2219161 RepID=A0A2W1MY02_9FLAO|nr:hypothetical protein [Putridiphycobacter roseus]PZE17049.1 hypothetical protein DNU06_09885 [Putridiphycobacter roseus]
MKNLNLTLILSLFLFLGMASCKKDKTEEPTTPSIENPGPNTSANPGVLDLGTSVNAKFFAQVVDESGFAVENATVKIGNKTTSTDENGIALIESASVKEKLAYMTVTKSGYFLGSRAVKPQTTSTNTVKITLLKLDVVASFNATDPTTVDLSSGLSVDFKGAFVNSAGTAYTGVVNVAIKHLQTTADDFSNQMPGSLYAQNESNNAGILESYGMAAVELFSPSGEELQIANGSNATIHMPVDGSQLANAPTSIPLWHFDEVAGYWIEEGEATLTNGKYVGNVNHFSFWNCDVFYDDATISGTIVDGNGNQVSFCSIEIVTPNASTTGTSNLTGSFFSYIPANVPVTFNILDNCGNQLTTWTNTFATNTTNTHTFTVSISNLSTISGTILDCNNNMVTNGYTVTNIGTNLFYANITNGTFNVALGNCITATSFTIEGFDISNLQSTGVLTYTTTPPNTTIGNIVACTAVSEYISYNIDGNLANTFLSPLYCNELIDSTTNTVFGLSISANSGQTYFQLELDDVALGNYNYMNSGTTLPSGSLFITEPINTAGGYPNINFNLTSYGAVGSSVDITISGSYVDQSNVSHTISGTVHALRDS